jgi:dihydroorotate dehydrogenase
MVWFSAVLATTGVGLLIGGLIATIVQANRLGRESSNSPDQLNSQSAQKGDKDANSDRRRRYREALEELQAKPLTFGGRPFWRNAPEAYDNEAVREELDYGVSQTLKETLWKLRDSGSSNVDDIEDYIREIGVLTDNRKMLDRLNIEYPIYNHLASYDDNLEPLVSSAIADSSDRPSSLHCDPYNFLGHEIDVPIPFGVGSSPLTRNIHWVREMAALGYNIITYKTVRNNFHPGFKFPNSLFTIGEDVPWPPKFERDPKSRDVVPHDVTVRAEVDAWPRSDGFSLVNSFGVPSEDSKEWMRDVALCSSRLRELNKIFIVNVMGDFEKFREDKAGLVKDYVEVAKNAERAGASIIEVNVSCPNLSDSNNPTDQRSVKDWSQKMETDLTLRIMEAVRGGLEKDTRLLVKFGALDRDMLEERLRGIIDYINGVSGINALQYPVDPRYFSTRAAAFIPNRGDQLERHTCAVSGEAIRRYAHDFVRHVRTIADELKRPDLEILAMGGVRSANDVIDLCAAGATAVQTVTRAFYHPSFALEVSRDLATYKELHPGEWEKLERKLRQRAAVNHPVVR